MPWCLKKIQNTISMLNMLRWSLPEVCCVQCDIQRKVWLPSVSRTDGHQTPPAAASPAPAAATDPTFQRSCCCCFITTKLHNNLFKLSFSPLFTNYWVNSIHFNSNVALYKFIQFVHIFWSLLCVLSVAKRPHSTNCLHYSNFVFTFLSID